MTLGLLGAAVLMTAQAVEPGIKATAKAEPSSAAVQEPALGFGRAVDATELARLNGGTEVTNNMTLTGSVSNTSTSYVNTGFNSIDGGAFGNAVGLPMVIQNSGNSVLIQNATIVNLQMQP